jgi:hypothetical protein
MKLFVIQPIDTDIEIPAGALIMWGGIDAPSGWSFDTDFDDCFVRGGSVLDLVLKGAVNHVHTMPGMLAGGAHNDHPINVAESGVPTSTGTGLSGYTSGAYTNSTHKHAGGSGAGESTSPTHEHTTPDTESASHLPEYVRLRYLSGAGPIPIGGIMVRNTDAGLPEGWVVCDGQNGTPDMRGKFVYGGSGVNGGSDSHIHENGVSSSAGSHPHTGIGITSTNVIATNGAQATSGGTLTNTTHGHSASNLSTPNAGAHEHPQDDTGSADNAPAYVLVHYIMRIA